MHIPRHRSHRSTSGALMAAALMLMIVSGIMVSSWVTLMSTRAAQVSYLEDICKRRVGVESSRLLGWQFVTSQAFERNGTLAASQNTVLGSDIGGFNTVNGWNNLNVYTSTSTAGGMSTVFPYNHTGLRPGASYLIVEQLARPSSGVAGNIDDFNAWQFLKSMPPVLNGDVFCVYRKPDGIGTELDIYNNAVSGGSGHHANWTVQGRTVVRHPPSFFVSSTPSPLQLPFLTKSLYIQSYAAVEPPAISYPVYGTDLTGNALLPSNLPVVPSTTGPIGGSGDRSHLGYLNVIKNNNNPDNSLWHFQDREAAAGRTPTITIDVASVFSSATEAYWIAEQPTPTYTPPGWPSGYDDKLKVLFIKLDSQYLKNMRIYGVVDQIIFVGQSNATAFNNAAALKPVIITIMPNGAKGRWVRDIRFERENNRRHVLAFQDDNGRPVEFSWVNNPISGTEFRWRSVLVNEYQSIMLNMPSSLTQSIRWIGGVMTNWTVKRRAGGGTNPSRLLFTGDSDPAVPAATNSGPAFATFLPRDAWLESYFLPVAP
ncbi:MAG: hypothetical protein ACKVY0_11765 [Prosthecobacter sp.]|uniref:hypothetical protein n=1 Tax=Prosthecobacter sp. TaxID=1965333 RepID=UPI003902087A